MVFLSLLKGYSSFCFSPALNRVKSVPLLTPQIEAFPIESPMKLLCQRSSGISSLLKVNGHTLMFKNFFWTSGIPPNRGNFWCVPLGSGIDWMPKWTGGTRLSRSGALCTLHSSFRIACEPRELIVSLIFYSRESRVE